MAKLPLLPWKLDIRNPPFRETVLGEWEERPGNQANMGEDTTVAQKLFLSLSLPQTWVELQSHILLAVTHSDDKQEADSTKHHFTAVCFHFHSPGDEFFAIYLLKGF